MSKAVYIQQSFMLIIIGHHLYAINNLYTVWIERALVRRSHVRMLKLIATKGSKASDRVKVQECLPCQLGKSFKLMIYQ
jgi:hypothetical protein